MRFPLHLRTTKLLKGLRGLEIGAFSHNPYGVNSQNVAPKSKAKHYTQEQINMCGEVVKIDIDGYAHKIPVEDNSVDFVLSSHLIGHLSDLEAVFEEWQRVTRPGGYIVIVAPTAAALSKKRVKTVSTLQDILGRIGTDNKHDKRYWVFSPESLVETVGHFQPEWELVGKECPDSKVGNGFWLAFSTTKRPTTPIPTLTLATRTNYPVTIIIPTLDQSRGEETAKIALAKAGCDAEVIVVSGPMRGFTKTVNEGLAQITGGDVCLLNDDIIGFPQNWLSDMLEGLHSDDRNGILGPSGTSGTAPACNGRPGMKGAQKCNQISFWCVLLRREMLDDIGYLDKRYIHYCSDNEYNIRAKKAGWRCIWLRSVYIDHEHHGLRSA